MTKQSSNDSSQNNNVNMLKSTIMRDPNSRCKRDANAFRKPSASHPPQKITGDTEIPREGKPPTNGQQKQRFKFWSPFSSFKEHSL